MAIQAISLLLLSLLIVIGKCSQIVECGKDDLIPANCPNKICPPITCRPPKPPPPTPTPSLSTAVASVSAVVSVITTSANIGNNVAASTLNSFTTSLSSTTVAASTTSIITTPPVTTQPPINCISLNSSYPFAILAGSTITNTGISNINGDLGLYPGTSVTGFPPGIVIGTQYVTDSVAQDAQNDLTSTYVTLFNLPCSMDLSGQDLGTLTLTSGVYCFSTSAQLTDTLILDAEGNNNAVFVFQIGSTLTTASSSIVNVINGGLDCNIYWQVGSSATLGSNSVFIGNILSLTSITANTGASVGGRLLARNGAVTLDTNVVSNSLCVTCLFPNLDITNILVINENSANIHFVSFILILISLILV